jgi:hypothetical protein
MRPSKRLKLKIDQIKDEVLIGDIIVCFSIFLYLYVTLNHISSEFQSYIGGLPVNICGSARSDLEPRKLDFPVKI